MDCMGPPFGWDGLVGFAAYVLKGFIGVDERRHHGGGRLGRTVVT